MDRGDALPREERKVWIYEVASTYTLYQVLNGEDVAGFSSLNLADLGYVMDKEISNFTINIDEERQYRYI